MDSTTESLDVSTGESGLWRFLPDDIAPSEAEEEALFEVSKELHIICGPDGLRQMSKDYFSQFPFSVFCLCLVMTGIVANEFSSDLEARRPSRSKVAKRSARKRKDFDPYDPMKKDPAFNRQRLLLMS